MSEFGASCLLYLMKAGVVVIDILTMPVHIMLNTKMWTYGKTEYQAKKIEVKDGVCYRSEDPLIPLQEKQLALGIDTVQKAHQYACETYGSKPVLGTRKIFKEFQEEQPNGKLFKKLELGDYSWFTYNEVDKIAKNLSSGLRELGCHRNSSLMILSETRAEWLMTLVGAFKQSIPVCTLYATLGTDGLIHGINESETKVLVTSDEMMPKVKSILKECPHLETIIYFPNQVKETDTEGFGDIEVFSFDDVCKMGAQNSYEDDLPQPEDVAVIMYTSGSTGAPKGVVLSHHNLMTALNIYIGNFKPRSNDTYIGYLPLAHVLELVAENLMFSCGIPIGYSSALTLTDRSTKIKRGQKGDVSLLKPTFITAVPLILDRLYKGILEKVAAQSIFLQKLFDYGISYKRWWSGRGFKTPFCDWFVLRKIRALLGGNLRVIACGGAPLSKDTHEFVRLTMGVPLLQGYGLTETCACTAIMREDDETTGRVGHPVVRCDIKLINWEEGSYRVDDKPNPRGEIVIGGEHVAVGYFKQPEKTAEEFYEEDGKRWFKTGDIGEYDPDGGLKIIDRKKDLVKLQIGEYVSLAKVEGALSSYSLVENICVYGDSNKNNIVAIITPNPAALRDLGDNLDKTGKSDEELCKDKEVIDHVLKEMVDIGKKAKLEKFELPTAVHLSAEAWTPDTGLVTAAFKLKRVAIKKHYQDAINRMYGA